MSPYTIPPKSQLSYYTPSFLRAFYKPLSFVTLKLKTSCKFISHFSPVLPSHSQHSLCLFHFTCKVSFSQTPYPHTLPTLPSAG